MKRSTIRSVWSAAGLFCLLCAFLLSGCQTQSASNAATRQPDGSAPVLDSPTLSQSEAMTDTIVNAPVAETITHRPDSSTDTAPSSHAMTRRVAYFTSWSAYARGLEIGDLDPSLLTHVNFAFANLSENGEITVGDRWVDTEKPFSGYNAGGQNANGHYGQLRQMKELYPDIKVLISVGGWTWSGNFSKVAKSREGRETFASSAVQFLTRYPFDGLDIDWEFPVEGGNAIDHSPDDRRNYTLLLQEVRAALDEQGKKDGKQYLLTIAGGPNISFTRNTELSAMMNYVDFINVMCYDYHGSWDARTGHNAPLYASDGLSVADTINAYLAAGAVPAKLNLGLAFYGRGWGGVADSEHGLGQPGTSLTGTGMGLGTWESAVFDYWDLDQNYLGKNGYERYFDSHARVPYLYNGSTFISYDDEESVREKLDFAAAGQLGGIMFWEFGGDKTKKLQKMIYEYEMKTPPVETAAATQGAVAAGTARPEDETAGFPAWSASAVYQKGERVCYNSSVYEAKWWTQGEAPDTHGQEWGVWRQIIP